MAKPLGNHYTKCWKRLPAYVADEQLTHSLTKRGQGSDE